ncbi:mechanosensitive ion channel domain-containing protein [Novosphingobium sp.]|uniref:mechanosensitive ion channel family protein n=1 Tax=Novosphingobium sp. TaxID=1874826 RepID=UPI0025F6000E|nr:mechanosensitive ion channel domain-containing protein [Novosphingobium sp.]
MSKTASAAAHAPVAAEMFGPDSPITRTVALLDRIGFDVGKYHISVWSALTALVVIAALLFAARLGGRISRHLFTRATRLEPAQRLLGEKLVTIVVWVVAFFVGIDVLGISLTALTVFSGAFGLAIGFGLQKTLGNLIAGIILLMDGSIKPGDVIGINDGPNSSGGNRTIGQVKKIGIRAVSVTTRDEKEYLIPNEILMTSQVENWSYSSRDVRVKVAISVAYGTDLDLAERLMLEAAALCPRVLVSPKSSVWLVAFGDNAIQFEMQLWMNDPEEGIGNLRSDVLKRVWHLFRDHGVEIPYPSQNIYVKQWPPAPDRPADSRA